MENPVGEKKTEPGRRDVRAFVARALKNPAHGVFVGVDPGATGGIAMLCGADHVVVDIPVFKEARTRRVPVKKKDRTPGGPKSKVVHGATSKFAHGDIVALFKLLRPVKDRVRCLVEVAKPMVSKNAGAKKKGGKGSDNVRTAYLVGVGYGMWPLFLLGRGFGVEEEDPGVWKKEFKLNGKPKEASRLAAARLWPRAALDRKKDHGRAEALLIAEYCRRRWLGRPKE